MAMRFIEPANPVLNQTISTATPVQSSVFTLLSMSGATAAWIVSVGAGLTATFNLMVSLDNVNFYDSGMTLPSVSGSAKTFPVQYGGGFPYVLIQVTQSAGSGTVKITGFAKGGA